MGEPTINEAVVDAVAKALFLLGHPAKIDPLSWERWIEVFGSRSGYHRQARAALAAAEPLMHEGCQAEVEEALAEADAKAFEVNRLRAQNARLRQAGFAQAAEVARLREALEDLLDWCERWAVISGNPEDYYVNRDAARAAL